MTVLEAETRHVGGRARTLRFEGDLYGEAGAMRIPERHELTRHYVRELDNHPWSSGAFAWFMPGQHSALYRDVIAPEGRIHFAGEHASLAHTWMQGAFESALRAVREMLASA